MKEGKSGELAVQTVTSSARNAERDDCGDWQASRCRGGCCERWRGWRRHSDEVRLTLGDVGPFTALSEPLMIFSLGLLLSRFSQFLKRVTLIRERTLLVAVGIHLLDVAVGDEDRASEAEETRPRAEDTQTEGRMKGGIGREMKRSGCWCIQY